MIVYTLVGSAFNENSFIWSGGLLKLSTICKIIFKCLWKCKIFKPINFFAISNLKHLMHLNLYQFIEMLLLETLLWKHA